MRRGAPCEWRRAPRTRSAPAHGTLCALPDRTLSPGARSKLKPTSLTMGLGRKANKEDTSATSTSGDESSCMPASGMAADLSNSALEVRRRSHKVADSTLPKPTCSGLVTRAHHFVAQARTSLPCPARTPRRPRQPISPRRCRSRLSSLMSPTTAHSLGSAPRCRPPPHACIRARHSEEQSSLSHAPTPPRPAGHQRGQVFLGRCTFLAGPQPAP